MTLRRTSTLRQRANFWARSPAILAVLVTIMGPTIVAADGDVPVVVAYFDAISGRNSDIEILRNGAQVQGDVLVRTAIHSGDYVNLTASGSTAVIRFTDGSTASIGPVEGWYGPYYLRGNESSLLTNWLAALTSTISELRGRPVPTVATAARWKGDPVTLWPLYRRVPLQLVEGVRQLSVQWGGGNPPYRFLLEKLPAADDPIVQSVLDESHIRTTEIDLGVGEYRVTIADDKSVESFEFVVVGHDAMPDLPGDDTANAVLSQFATAYALALIDDSAWVFESCQRFADLGEDGYAPAAILVDELLDGAFRYWDRPDVK
jgi:hypothetical protein